MSRLAVVFRQAGIICAIVSWFGSSVAADPLRVTWDRLVQARAVGESVEFGSFETSPDNRSDLPGLVNIGVTAETTSPDFGLPQLASATATQRTNVSTAGWSGVGAAAIDVATDPSAYGYASAESLLWVNFTLSKPTPYQLTGTVTGEGSDIRLDAPPGLGWVFESGSAVPLVAMRRGLLSPGTYSFEARAHTENLTSGRSAFDVQFTFGSPVPEPATWLLLGTGAACLGRRAWRRRDSAPVLSD